MGGARQLCGTNIPSGQKQKGFQLLGTLLSTAEFLVGRAGLEPATNGLKVRCSTN